MRDLAGEGGLGLLGTLINEAGGEEQSLGGFVHAAAHGAATDKQGSGPKRTV